MLHRYSEELSKLQPAARPHAYSATFHQWSVYKLYIVMAVKTPALRFCTMLMHKNWVATPDHFKTYAFETRP